MVDLFLPVVLESQSETKIVPPTFPAETQKTRTLRRAHARTLDTTHRTTELVRRQADADLKTPLAHTPTCTDAHVRNGHPRTLGRARATHTQSRGMVGTAHLPGGFSLNSKSKARTNNMNKKKRDILYNRLVLNVHPPGWIILSLTRGAFC